MLLNFPEIVYTITMNNYLTLSNIDYSGGLS